MAIARSPVAAPIIRREYHLSNIGRVEADCGLLVPSPRIRVSRQAHYLNMIWVPSSSIAQQPRRANTDRLSTYTLCICHHSDLKCCCFRTSSVHNATICHTRPLPAPPLRAANGNELSWACMALSLWKFAVIRVVDRCGLSPK